MPAFPQHQHFYSHSISQPFHNHFFFFFFFFYFSFLCSDRHSKRRDSELSISSTSSMQSLSHLSPPGLNCDRRGSQHSLSTNLYDLGEGGEGEGVTADVLSLSLGSARPSSLRVQPMKDSTRSKGLLSTKGGSEKRRGDKVQEEHKIEEATYVDVFHDFNAAAMQSAHAAAEARLGSVQKPWV